jgi:hypothetical protein
MEHLSKINRLCGVVHRPTGYCVSSMHGHNAPNITSQHPAVLMPAPPEFKISVVTSLAQALAQAIEPELDALWDKACEAAMRAALSGTAVRVSPPQPEAIKSPTPRVAKGYAQEAVLKAITKYSAAGSGAARDDIRRASPGFMGGQKLKDNSLKAILKTLRESEQIELRDGRWWSVKRNGDR